MREGTSPLGDATGLSNVHANRTLQDMRRQGLIAPKNGRLTILDLPRLKAAAEFRSSDLQIGERAAA